VRQEKRMSLFTLEHSKAAYGADFVVYCSAVVMLAAFLLLSGPRSQRLVLAVLVLAGLAGWTLVEYALHRFVMHGLQPFSRLHAQHHKRPTARIYTPTLLSATLIVTLVFLPAWAMSSFWQACSLTLGVLTGYLVYSITHHATHNWRAGNAWTRRRKRWHALHHQDGPQPGYYGVTSAFWDHVFGSARRPAATAQH